MEQNTDNEESKDNPDWGNLLLQKPHAEEGQQQSSETRNQLVQVVLQSRGLDLVKSQTASLLCQSIVDTLRTLW